MTAAIQPEQASWLLQQLAGNVNATHTFVTLPVAGGKPAELNTSFFLAQDILERNNTHSGVFFTPNAIFGKRSTANVHTVRALFVDLDSSPLQPLQESSKKANVSPHICIESSPGRYHAYWLISDCTLDQFTPLQKALARRFGGDPAVCDLPRLMRLPGFNHRKMKHGELTEPFMTCIIDAKPEQPRYTVAELLQGLQLDLSPPPSTKNPEKPQSERFDLQRALVDGERTNSLTQLSGRLISQGLDDAQALEMLVAWNTSRCHPPLPDDKLQSTLASIRRTDERNKSDGGQTHPLIAELNARHAIVVTGSRVLILREGAGSGDIDLMTAHDFKLLHSNHKVEGTSAGSFWLNHPERRTYERLTFDPTNRCGPNAYNLWKGFAVVPVEGNCTLYLDHIRDNICSASTECYEYLLNWMAHAVQQPHKLPGVAIVLRSDQGTGKGVFATNFGMLFGKTFKQLTSRQQLVGRFSGHLMNTLVAFADELTWGGMREEAGMLKTLITEPHRMIEMKGKDAIELPNFCRLIVATNEAWAVPTDMSDRRMFVLDVGTARQQDTTYFTAIQHQMDNGGREALLHLLLSRVISAFNVRQFPKTQARLQQQLLSLDSVDSWWLDRLEAGYIGPASNGGQLMEPCLGLSGAWPVTAETDLLYRYYCRHAREAGERYPKKKNAFARRLRELAGASSIRPKLSDGNRPYCYKLPALDECRARFNTAIGQPVDWGDDEDGA